MLKVKRTRVMVVVLVAEVVYLAKKKIDEHFEFVCLQPIPHSNMFHDMAIDKDGAMSILSDDNNVELKVNGETVKKWEG